MLGEMKPVHIDKKMQEVEEADSWKWLSVLLFGLVALVLGLVLFFLAFLYWRWHQATAYRLPQAEEASLSLIHI